MVTKDMLIVEALQIGQEKGVVDKMAETLQSFGMHCLGCALARGESLEDAAAVHGIDVDEMVAALNACIG